MLGQLFLFVCVLAMFAVAGILFVVFGPVPVKRRVTVIARISGPRFVSTPVAAPTVPSLVSQLAPAHDQVFTPDTDFLVEERPATVPAASAMPMPARKPKGAKVQPLPRKRAAKGTDSPFAPVVRSRSYREEELATSPVRRVTFDSGEMTTVDDF